MTESSQNKKLAAAENTTKPCSMCGEPIQLTARKCIHCNSYLGWWRWIGLSQVTLALVIALISVIATSTPIINKALQVSGSQLQAIFVAQNPQFPEGKVSLLVSNDGTKTGVIVDAVLVPDIKGRPQISLQPAHGKPIFIGPGVARPVRLTFNSRKSDVPNIQAVESETV